MHEVLFTDDIVYSINGTITSPPGLWHSVTQRDVTGTPGEGGRAVGSRHLASTTAGTAAATPPRGHTSHSRPDWHSLVEQHSPGLLAGKKMSLLIGDGPISAVTEAPRLGFLSLTPFRPGRGYGAGPDAV